LFTRVIGALFGAVVLASPVSATPIDLGDAAGFNGFFRQGFESGPNDSQGGIAAGGDVRLTGYTVNTLGQREVPALVSGGSVYQQGGDINGNVFAAGNYVASGGAGVHSGSVSQNGAVPVDFGTTFSRLESLSADLASQGQATALNGGKLTFVGDGSTDTQIFNIEAASLTQAWGWFAEDIAQDQAVVINVSGSAIDIDAGDYLMKAADWSWIGNAESVLFNFYEASTIDLHGAFYGTILAPTAAINAVGGMVNGQVIADSWAGQAQLNAPLFAHHESVAVPEPATLALLLVGFGGLLLSRRGL